MSSFKTIRYDVAAGIATITLNRPEQLNAFDQTMLEELCAALDLSDTDDAVKAVIVTGAGRAFCAGADLSTGSKTFDYEAGDGGVARDLAGQFTLRAYRSLKPIISAVNGAAVGVGITMQLAMDIRLASTSAKFGFVFTRRGIVPEGASSWFLPRLVGMSTALEWCMTGRIFGAEEAHRSGLVRSLHAPDELLPAARALATEIVENTSAVSVAVTRQMFWRMVAVDHPMKAHEFESRALYHRGKSADAREGIASFLEKRAASYPDRVTQNLPDFFDWRSEPPFV
ncbi:crotonase/enoyl-CoA hydratase family protein [Steroidobacter sp.]|uniref:crotonase/enoyl-CoA hydratase family protein n=1 Tax=Steroidobacter sp. TaxID=1978227 RepID=UPI001A44872D|nr:crotonase/enoyl-CoA hydratase family protein [Steroidobacter sp.]MBL8270075.1 crotonase/enoyl-CoA hydratase family protein [Steroidobacter sp.]